MAAMPSPANKSKPIAVAIAAPERRARALALPRIADETPNGVRTVIVRAPKLVNVVPA